MYQSRLCGLPPDWGVEYRGIRFDGCDPATGTLLECKALGFEKKMSRLGGFQKWYEGAQDPFDQMSDQQRAGRAIGKSCGMWRKSVSQRCLRTMDTATWP